VTGEQIPAGTVTLLFTDIEGSTRLWEAEPDPMAAALRQHDQIMRGSIERAGGYVFKTVGDSFCAAFGTAQSAIDAVLAAQRALSAQSWPTSRPVLVRMGLHTGACEERDGDYFGPVVNRAARLEAVAHGGQVLLSGVTADLLADLLPPGVTLRDLGLHRLKDLGRPEQVYQLEAEFLAATFPPLSSLDNPELPNNLPSVLSPFVGRDHEVAQVRGLVAESRLVTLTGAGGSGKTRLALQVAAELVEGVADGVWLAELASCTGGEQIPEVVAAVLGIQGESAAAVTDALSGQQALLVLDNCEHLIDAAAKFSDQVIRACPKVSVLATSREPLGIDGELVYRVPSMSLPELSAETVEDLGGSDAALLFAARARVHGLELDDSSARLVATICRRLDGIPLALELAAARLSSMSLQQVTDRLDQRFRLLTGGSRNAMPRQQTLQATVDWSFSLLNNPERATLLRLSVFASGFELEAAESVCATGEVDAFDVADLLGSLVDKSLVVADRAGDSVRYRLLETIRQYAAQELVRSAGDDEVLRIRDRHAEYYLAFAELAAPELSRSAQGVWLRRLDAEWDNLRAAFSHLRAEGRAGSVVRLALALARFVLSRVHTEVVGYLTEALDLGTAESEQLRAQGHQVAALLTLQFLRKDPASIAEVPRHAELALALARAAGDRRVEARALGTLFVAAFSQRRDDAGELGAQALAVARSTGDPHVIGEILSFSALDDLGETARLIHEEALAIFRSCGDVMFAANELHALSGMDLAAGLVGQARDHVEQAIALVDGLGDEVFLYGFRGDLAVLLLIQGEYEPAATALRQCLLVARRTGGMLDTSELIFCAGCIAGWQGEDDRAARLFGAGDRALADAMADGSIRWTPPEQELTEREHSTLRSRLGDGPFAAAYQAGSALSPAEALELALGRGLPERIATNSR
jgi:predicted ATPase/class 3 adenylate cyclase